MSKKDVNNNGNGNSFNYGTSHVYDDPHSAANQPLDSVRKVDPMPNGAEQNHGSNYCSIGKAWKRFWKRGAKGCAPRSEYWWSQLMVFLISIICKIVIGVAFFSILFKTDGDLSGGAYAFIVPACVIFAIFAICFTVNQIMLFVRRCHDIGWSGWWWAIIFALTLFSTFVAPLFYLVALGFGLWITLCPSKFNGNKYRA